MEHNREKRKIKELFSDKRFLYAVAAFLLIAFVTIYQMVSQAGKPTAAEGENAINATVPTAMIDTTQATSKLELQSEVDPMAMPGIDPAVQNKQSGLQSPVPETINPYLYQKKAKADDPEMAELDAVYTTKSNDKGNARNQTGKQELDEEEEEGAQPADLQKQLAERKRLLVLLEEYRRDKELKKVQQAEQMMKPQKVVDVPVVSSLDNPMPGRGNDFYGLHSDRVRRQQQARNDSTSGTLRAVIHQDQTIINGGRIGLRLLEAINVRGTVIPAGTLVYGLGQFSTERVNVHITSIQYENRVYPIRLTVYDMDGISGIYVPNILAVQESRRAAAQAATGINIQTPVMGTNAAAVAGASAANAGINGLRSFFSRKANLRKAHLKDDYYVLLR
ncbi:hypothetical protein GCM10023189_40670 [Nibrella saemangeumensis]|uniref:Conjugative transposon TraM C-terminal domain-containing protein n=1 Tax=Nibrella saemangeumensis TaxID=1084526 RepID=A0ABP8NB93_9BACT